MKYSEVVNKNLILDKKSFYTMWDVYNLMTTSLFIDCNSTLTLQQAKFIIKCSACFHNTEYSRTVSETII